MSEPDIHCEKRGRLGLVSLNRGHALNALTHDMVLAIAAALDDWAKDDEVAHVAIRSRDEKAFSAGGDLKGLYDAGLAAKAEGRAPAASFFTDEYRLNHAIRTYPKPYIALIDGIVMGGGVGVSVNGSHRVAGERISFAMPEVGIGFFPDVGGTYILPRVPCFAGTWLALTGARIGRADCLWAGLATQATAGARFAELIEALSAGGETDDILERFAEDGGPSDLEDDAARFAEVFSADSVEEIVERLKARPDWERGQKALDAIGTKSPTSLKIALRQMQLGAEANFAETMRTEYRIVHRVLGGHDLYEGIRAQIVDKDRDPKWAPPSLAEVGEADIDAYFAPLDEELPLPEAI
ncbi:enoyl-CoA hydratase/isomerase family protein [Afifella sp. IM 167]|uniref:enoyl-CoA hydratase/isomerase family protein n=1 Tax=Afifella sp. IM 167 TaxID=2033586 RepID=UPI001CC95258|nr:enoyl-CoA hydratase/isomerase family protein [Afifella sp. IM 167]MBZ8132604.1 3-hydroxyisobutyryl-CoA hydrolase [Afifella sp. IM 167]